MYFDIKIMKIQIKYFLYILYFFIMILYRENYNYTSFLKFF